MTNNYYSWKDLERFEFVASLVPAFSTVLDVGARDSTFKQILEGHGHKVIALDIDPLGKDVIQGDITKLPFADNSFDCVVAMEILEHLTFWQLLGAIREVKRVATNTVIISVPDDEVPLGKTHLQRFNASRLKSYFCDYQQEFWPIGQEQKYQGLQKWLAKTDMRLLHLVSRLWGIRRKEGAIWLVARFTKEQEKN